MNDQTQQTSIAPLVYFVLWFIFMCWLSAPPGTSLISIIWTLFAGTVLLVEVAMVGGWFLKKVL